MLYTGNLKMCHIFGGLKLAIDHQHYPDELQ